MIRGVARHHHLQCPGDPSSAVAAQHAGVAHLGISVRPSGKIGQAHDPPIVAGDKEAVQQHRGPLEDAATERLRRRVLPIDVRLVRHVTPDGQHHLVELVARGRGIDRREGNELDAFPFEPGRQHLEPAQVNGRRRLDRAPVPFQLDVPPRRGKGQRGGKVALSYLGLDPSEVIGCGKTLHLIGQASADTLPSMGKRHAHHRRGAILVSRAVFAEHSFGRPGESPSRGPRAEPQDWLLGWPQCVIEAQGLDVVLPVAGLVGQLEPGRQFRWLDRPNHDARVGDGHKAWSVQATVSQPPPV